MASLQSLFVLAALSAGPDTVLLNFYSESCGPCRVMAPVVQRLIDQGMPVRRIDVAREPQLAERFRVTGIPCFVMFADGREVDRVEGATSIARLQKMLAAARPAEQVREANPAGEASSVRESNAARESAAARNRSAVIQRALEATVRIRVDDATGQSWGTGTIIDTQGDEALIVTCGHIFRDSKGQGRIQIDLFAPGAKGSIPGHLIGYESQDRDIGLIAIRPGIRVQPVVVAPAAFAANPGDAVFSIGCDKGGNPSVRTSQVTGVNKYLGAPNVEVAGQPVDGRSGGGLFAADGRLMAICNAADPQDDEGVYASWQNIHWQLAQVGLQRLFEQHEQLATQPAPSRHNIALTAASAPGPLASRQRHPAPPPQMPERMAPAAATANSGLERPLRDALPDVARTDGYDINPADESSADDDTEVVVTVRSRSRPQHQSRTFVVNQPSVELLARLNREHERSDGPRVADRAASRGPNSSAPRFPADDRGGPIIRAQSADR